MQMTIPTKLHAYHLEKFRFDLQRFASGTVTPTTGRLKNGSTIKVTFKNDDGDVEATFTYNATTNNPFSETHSSWGIEAARANISNNNIVIQLNELNADFSESDHIITITLDTADNKWILTKGAETQNHYDYAFSFNGTTISYDSNNTFSSNFYNLISGYIITIDGKTYSVDFDNSNNLTSVNGTALSNGRVTLDGKTYTFSGNTSSITYSYNEWTFENGVAKYSAGSNVLVAIDGLKNPTATDGAISGLTVDETAKTVTVASDLLGEKDVKITGSSDYTLKLAYGVTAPQTTGGSFESFTYKSGGGTGTRLYTFFRQKNSQLL